MKKLCIAALALVLCLGLTACGSKKDDPKTTTRETKPMTMPTVETNIPDPTVNDNSTRETTHETTGGMTEGATGGTEESTDSTHTTGETHGEDMGRRIFFFFEPAPGWPQR